MTNKTPFAPAFPDAGKEGMSLLDYIATHALQGLVATAPETPPNEAAAERLAYAEALAALLCDKVKPPQSKAATAAGKIERKCGFRRLTPNASPAGQSSRAFPVSSATSR